MSKKLLALVKWVGGEDDRKYTVGVPVDWIKSFNYEEYLTTNEENTYVIEWHGSSKMPVGGWDCYDGYVIEVSDRLSYLKQKLNQIDGILSPTKAVTLPTTTDEAPKENDGDNEKNLPHNGSISNKGKASNNNQIKGNSNKSNVVEKEVPPLMRKQRRLEMGDTSRQNNNLITDDESDIDEINSSSKLIKQMIQGNQKIEHQLTKVCKELRSQRKKRRRDSSSGSSSDSDEEEPMVRIGPKKSGVRVTCSQWRTAKAQATYTAMGLSLLTALFPVEVLLRSNLKGGSRKIQGQPNTPKFEALDKKIREAIYYTVETHHPKTFNATGLGISMNNKLNSLRRAAKIRATEAAQQLNPDNNP